MEGEIRYYSRAKGIEGERFASQYPDLVHFGAKLNYCVYEFLSGRAAELQKQGFRVFQDKIEFGSYDKIFFGFMKNQVGELIRENFQEPLKTGMKVPLDVSRIGRDLISKTYIIFGSGGSREPFNLFLEERLDTSFDYKIITSENADHGVSYERNSRSSAGIESLNLEELSPETVLDGGKNHYDSDLPKELEL